MQIKFCLKNILMYEINYIVSFTKSSKSMVDDDHRPSRFICFLPPIIHLKKCSNKFFAYVFHTHDRYIPISMIHTHNVSQHPVHPYMVFRIFSWQKRRKCFFFDIIGTKSNYCDPIYVGTLTLLGTRAFGVLVIIISY